MKVQCDWHFDSTVAGQLGICKGKSVLEIQRAFLRLLRVLQVPPLHPLSAAQRPCQFGSNHVNKQDEYVPGIPSAFFIQA